MKYVFCGHIVLIAVVFFSCRNTGEKTGESHNAASETVRYANHFNIVKFDGYTKLTIINPWQKSSDLQFDYYLVRRGFKPPAGVDSLSVIYVPIRKVVLMSTTYLPLIISLGEAESLNGLSGTGYVFNSEIRKRINQGKVADVGYEEYLNKEIIIKLSPDLIMAYGVGSEAAGNMRKLQEAGIKVIFNADYLEDEPLGRAEWIKVFGALYCQETRADSIFRAVENNYNRLKSFILEKIKYRPKVMLGLPWQGSWYVSPGNSYISKLIRDAGGEYVWENINADHAVPFGVENVFVTASDADFWLNTGSAHDLESLLSVDWRLAFLKPVKSGNLYNNNKRLSDRGGNDYWESGTINPDVILRDIASILHPDLFPGYEKYYYKKLE